WEKGESSAFQIANAGDGPLSMTFLRMGRWLIVGSSTVIDVATREVAVQLPKGEVIVGATDTRLIARQGNKDRVVVWDIEQRKAIGEIPILAASKICDANNHVVIEECRQPAYVGDETNDRQQTSQLNIWDMATFQRRYLRQYGSNNSVNAVC